MKYIHIAQYHTMTGGGVGSVITDLCEATARESNDVYVLCLFRKEIDDFDNEIEWGQKHGINVLQIQNTPKMGVLGVLKRLRKTLKELAKDDECCLYLHLKWGMLAGLVSSFGLKNIRRVEVYHSGYMNYKLQAFVSRPFTHHYLSVSKEAKQQLIDWFHVDGRKVTVAYNGVDLEHIRELGAHRVSIEGNLNFMSVGRLSFEKGFLQSIEAFGDMKEAGELKGATYTMIGNGPQMEESKEKAKGHVNFTGLIPRDSVYSNIASCDVMVLPSWWEGNSILLLEVLAIGKAMIVSDIPSFREVLDYKPLADDETCRLEPFGAVFRAKDTESCKAAMRLIEANKEKLGEMAGFVGGLADTFSIKNQVKIYKSVAEKVFEK